MMTRIAVGTLSLLLAARVGASEVGHSEKPTFRGDAAKLEQTTDGGKSCRLSLDRRNRSDASCKTGGRQQGGELILQLGLGGAPARRCELTMHGNICPGKALSIELKAACADLEGQFAASLASSQTLTLGFQGNSPQVALAAGALRADIRASLGKPEMRS
nr:hypothetical protein [Chromobacterium sp. ASV5]